MVRARGNKLGEGTYIVRSIARAERMSQANEKE